VKLAPTPQNTGDVTPAEVRFIRPLLLQRPAPIAAKARNIVLDVVRNGLVVVDVQNDFCGKEGWRSDHGADRKSEMRQAQAS
jgi:hypothetical protein